MTILMRFTIEGKKRMENLMIDDTTSKPTLISTLKLVQRLGEGATGNLIANWIQN